MSKLEVKAIYAEDYTGMIIVVSIIVVALLVVILLSLRRGKGKKIIDSPLENYVEVIAITKPDEPVADRRIVHQLIIKGRRLQAYG